MGTPELIYVHRRYEERTDHATPCQIPHASRRPNCGRERSGRYGGRSSQAFRPTQTALTFHKVTEDKTSINTYKSLRQHIRRHITAKQYDPWQDSRAQGHYMKHGFEPTKTYEYFLKNLRGKHKGTLVDVLTRGITTPSYKPGAKPLNCLYCKHVRTGHKNRALTPEHLVQCSANPHARKNLKEEILQQVTEAWEPELSSPPQEPDDSITAQARTLVNGLRTKRAKGMKLLILTKNGWLGHIMPWDLDRLATMYVQHRTKKGLPISQDHWL